MDELGKIHQLIFEAGGYNLTFDLETIIATWVVITILLVFGYFAARKKQIYPSSVQLLGELIISQLSSLTEDALEEALQKRLPKQYAPLIISVFLFVLCCNWIGLIPCMEEPTKNLNTPLSLGLLGFIIAHYTGIREKGIKVYLKGYLEPFFFLLPLNLIGELAKVISISFRLFGNILGGSIIILVVSSLTYSVILPPFLLMFFTIFIGMIQAFVFTILTLVYIGVQAR